MGQPSVLKRMQTSTILTPDIKLPFKKRLRVFTEDRRVEGTIILVVLLYFAFICMDFAVPEIVLSAEGGIFTDQYQQFIISWSRVFWLVDLIFLSIFLVEICLRVYAWGGTYLRDWLNVVDMIIVMASFGMLFATMQITLGFGENEESTGVESALQLLRVLRIVRIVRIVIILNKIKRSRENAQIMRKKAKYRRQGSPVERVVEILQKLRRKAESGHDRDNLSFIMDAIISDQLYTVSVNTNAEGGLDENMSAFLIEGGAQTTAPRKRGVLGMLGASTKGLARGASKRFQLESSLPINLNHLVRLLVRIEQGYNQVPFHNHMHAADVVHGTAYFLSQEAVARHVSPLDIYCMLIGAAIHDFAHPGYNNAFLVASRHETSITYNDVSVLENFHIASAWRLMLEDDLNPFHGFTDEQYNEARQTMVYAILGTDMKFHFDHLTKFKTRLGAGAFEDPDRKDVRLLLAMCLHSADVSNPAKPWSLSVEWSARVMEEFFLQGEKEAELGLPVSPFMDRKKTDIGQCQSGFISILIKPFFDEFTQFLGESNRHIFDNIETNIKTWQEQGEDALGDRLAILKAGRPPKGE